MSLLDDALESFKTSDDQEYAQRGFLRAQSAALAGLSELRDHYRAARPRGVGLSQRLRRDLDGYNAAFDSMVKTVVEPTERQVESLLEEAARGSLVAIDRRIRFHRAIEQSVEDSKSRVAQAALDANVAATGLRVNVGAIARDARLAVDDVGNECLSKAGTINVSALSDDEFVECRLGLESSIIEAAEKHAAILEEIRDQLASLTWERDEAGELVSGLDMAESVADEILELRERLDADLELSQLGMAVKVINHEFETTIRAVRGSLRKLRAWSDANPSIRPIYQSISNSFEHLDGYLRLFTPLQRRLYRNAVDIKGSDIGKFINELFEERLAKDNVVLKESRAFKSTVMHGFPSTYYPVFVNLVDNALYWLQHARGERVISFDAEERSIIVSNSGSGIGVADRERIFEQGFSRRPGGRGLGLYISREVLRSEGGDLTVEVPKTGHDAAFRLTLPAEPIVRE